MGESKYVVFRLGAERYGLPIESVERIVPTLPVTRVPRSPKAFLGLFDLRGETVPAIDAALRFEVKGGEATNFVVVLTPEGRCALTVDRVEGIYGLEPDQIEGASLLANEDDDFMAGVGKHEAGLIVLLDAAGVVPKAMRKRVAAAAA